jgi:hypothetical protein
MNGDVQVRFCERLGGQFPGPTRLADSVAGARASANLYGLIETAKANRIEPGRYLAYLFEVLPTVTEPEQLDVLLPQNIDPGALTRAGS